MPFELVAHDGIVLAQAFLPTLVPEPCGRRGRVHDVGEQHRRQDAVRWAHAPGTREELLDLVQERGGTPLAQKAADLRQQLEGVDVCRADDREVATVERRDLRDPEPLSRRHHRGVDGTER